jgi:hypothetical protein
MLSVGALVLVATPVVATPLFLAGIRWGFDPPRLVLADLATLDRRKMWAKK